MKTLIKVPAAYKDQANEVARQMQRAIDGTDYGNRTFSVPLFDANAGDDLTPIAYWCAVKFSPVSHATVDATVPQFPGTTSDDYDPIEDPTFPDRKLAEWGLRRALPKLP